MTILYNLNIDSYSVGQFNEVSNKLGKSINGTINSTAFVDVSTELGEKAIKFKLISDGTGTTYRSEVKGENTATNILAQIDTVPELWVGFDVWFPTGESFNRFFADEFAFFQVHYDKTSPVSPPIVLYVDASGEIKVNHRFNTTLNNNATNNNNNIVAFRSVAQAEFGRWMNFKIHYKQSYTAAGILEVYKDGRLVYSDTYNPNMFNCQKNAPTDTTQCRSYFKFGIYCYGWISSPPSAGKTRTSFYKNFIVADSISDLI